MFDELFEILDRDRRRSRSRHGIRGWLRRLIDPDDTDARDRAPGARPDRRSDAWDDDDLRVGERRLVPVTVRREPARPPRQRREPLDWDI